MLRLAILGVVALYGAYRYFVSADDDEHRRAAAANPRPNVADYHRVPYRYPDPYPPRSESHYVVARSEQSSLSQHSYVERESASRTVGRADHVTGEQYRRAASRHAQLRDECFARSKEAWQEGNREQAKALSDQGKLHGARMKHYNEKAAAAVLKENNEAKGRGLNIIDLHGLRVEEAIQQVKERIHECLQAGLDHFVAIVGRGNNSTGNIPRIKPKLQAYLEEHGYEYVMER